MTTVQKPKYVKYWEHETPTVFETEKNEVRFFSQHGKVQVYPKIATGRGIGKGATINFDSFSAEELKAFGSYLDMVYESGAEGYLTDKKYWENEEPGVVDSTKNQIRFYHEHGKIQVFPKIETGNGIGRGATINLAEIDFTEEVAPMIKAFENVLEVFLNAPDFSAPAPQVKPDGVPSTPKAPENVVATPSPALDNAELIMLLLANVDPAVKTQIEALLNKSKPAETKEVQPQVVVEAPPVKAEPKQDKPSAEPGTGDWRDEVARAYKAKTDEEIIAEGFARLLKGTRMDKVIQIFIEKGKKEAVAQMKKEFSTTGTGQYGINCQGSAANIKITSLGREFKFTYTKAWDKFIELYPTAIDDVKKKLAEKENVKPVVVAPTSTMGSIDDEEYIFAMEAKAEAEETVEEVSSPPASKSKKNMTHEEYAESLTNAKLLEEYEKSSNVTMSQYNPELTVALFEEIKSRKNRGAIKF